MIHQKQIEKFKQLPKREKVGFNLKSKSWYEEDFKKSSNEFFGLGKIYFIKCGNKHVGKPVQQLIYKLKNHSNYIHNKAFKDAIDDCIKSDLLTKVKDPFIKGYNNSDNSFFYVDENNLVQDIFKSYYSKFRFNNYLHDKNYFLINYPQYKDKAETLWRLHCLKIESKCFEYYYSTFKYIVRYNGLHYYVTNEELDYIDIEYKYLPKLKATHQVVINNSLRELQLLKLSTNDLKYHGLVDIKENIYKFLLKVNKNV